MRQSNTSRAAAFTFVELLVVIVILSLLLLMVVPALRRAMALAQQTKCKRNLGDQAKAHTLYASENHFNKPPIVWKFYGTFGYYLVTPNVRMYDQAVGQGILVKENYVPLRTLLCPSSSMLDDTTMDEESWVKKTISGSSYSYFWRHTSSFGSRDDLLTEYKYTDAEREGRYGLSMDFNAQSGHTYIGANNSSDWASHPILGSVNIAYSDGTVVSEENGKVVLSPPFNRDAKMKWWELAHKARQ
ncbi:MAG: prepilin-type N-terminal cleavage/methylation domain-containing protein [Phycisphaerae bacterium]|jgi:type II secretory pathway pseudopilin PulG|nr:prepilin-type N-terminal cleavage/methylation domain-containing protein [Phycisphaerae bacterium]